ncbi:ABC transporter substrate-binding protein [Roseibium sp. LAB1]
MARDETDPPAKGRARKWARKLLFAGILLVLGLGVLGVALSRINSTAPTVSRLAGYLADLFGQEDDSLTLVAVYSDDSEDSNFVNGVRMAVAQVNATRQLVLGKPLKLEFVREAEATNVTPLETIVSRTLKISGKIAKTDNLLAVIGHEWSDTAVTASSVYARENVLFLATQATARSLTDHDFDTVFALQPDNSTNAHIVASYALKQGLKRYIVLSDKTDYGKESANFFSEAVANEGAELVYRGFLSGTQRSIDDLLMFVLDNKLFKRTDFDAFFIVSSSVQETAEFIKRARYLGLDVPVLGMEYMFSEAIEAKVGKAGMKDVIGVSLYDRDTISEKGKAFAADFESTFDRLPDLNAAIGYDATLLIRDAVNRAETLDPGHVSDILKVSRYKNPFSGVTGPLVFDRNGLITDTHIFIVRHDGTEFRTVDSIKIPLGPKSVLHLDPQDGEGPDANQTEALPSAMETIGQ